MRVDAELSVSAPFAAPEEEPSLNPEQLTRCIAHIVHYDLKRGDAGRLTHNSCARRLVSPEATGPSAGELAFGDGGLELDSLAKISAASAVSRFFDLGVTGLDDHLLFAARLDEWSDLVARHIALRGRDAEIVFQTSGSTDAPRRVRKRLSALCHEVDALMTTLVPGATARIVALPPPQHIFGFLFTVLLPARLGVPVMDVSHRGTGSTMRQLSDGDLVVGTPFHWKSLLDEGGVFPRGVVGITSAGALPRRHWDDLSSAGLTGLLEIFGSTETGGLGWRGDGDAAFRLLPGMARDGDALVSCRSGDRIPLQDRLEWIDDQRFRPLGRLDKAVKIAGVNVSLRKVEEILMMSGLASDAAVRPGEDRLKAFVVPSRRDMSHAELDARLRAHMRTSLEAAACPASYSFGTALPRNEMGKLTDW